MAEQIGTVTADNKGLMPAFTKVRSLRKADEGGILLFQIKGAYCGCVAFFTTVSTRGRRPSLFVVSAHMNADNQGACVKNLIESEDAGNRNTTVKYIKTDDILSVYLVRDVNILMSGAEVIYSDGVIAFMQNVDEIPADAQVATIL